MRPEATSFPPPVPIEAKQRRARTQTVGQPDEVYPRSPGHRVRVTKGRQRDITSYRVIAKFVHNGQSLPRVKTEESGPKRRDWPMICKQ